MKSKSVKKAAKIVRNSRNQTIAAIVVIVAAAILGYFLFIASHASTPFVSIEAESGTLDSGNIATKITDSTASGGTAVQFGALPGGGGGGGKPLIGWWDNATNGDPLGSNTSTAHSTLDYGSGTQDSMWTGPSGKTSVNGRIMVSIGIPISSSGVPGESSAQAAAQATTNAQNLVKNYPNAIVRPIWEFNGPGVGWGGISAQNFTAYWQAIVMAMKAVQGAHFLYFWCPQEIPNVGSLVSNNASQNYYPLNPNTGADDLVDIVGFDTYDGFVDLSTQTSDFNQLIALAKAHGKYVGIGEWGLNNTVGQGKGPGGTGGDDPAFINLIAGLVNNPANNFIGEWYFDASTSGGGSFDSQLVGASKTAYINDFTGQ